MINKILEKYSSNDFHKHAFCFAIKTLKLFVGLQFNWIFNSGGKETLTTTFNPILSEPNYIKPSFKCESVEWKGLSWPETAAGTTTTVQCDDKTGEHILHTFVTSFSKFILEFLDNQDKLVFV